MNPIGRGKVPVVGAFGARKERRTIYTGPTSTNYLGTDKIPILVVVQRDTSTEGKMCRIGRLGLSNRKLGTYIDIAA
jgi:hypothetical protein